MPQCILDRLFLLRRAMRDNTLPFTDIVVLMLCFRSNHRHPHLSQYGCEALDLCCSNLQQSQCAPTASLRCLKNKRDLNSAVNRSSKQPLGIIDFYARNSEYNLISRFYHDNINSEKMADLSKIPIRSRHDSQTRIP